MKQQQTPAPKAADHLKRFILMLILALSWFSSNAGWAIMEGTGKSSAVLRVVFGLNMAFHPVMFGIMWKRLLPQRAVEIACLFFAAIICAGCMALCLYSPTYGASLDIKPLYLWIPVIYVFVFTVAGHRTSLAISLVIYALFIAIALPYLAGGLGQPYGNFTVQLLLVSTILIAALYFFSSYQYRFQIAQLSVDELARLANTDELTKLANRRRMTETIAAELLRLARYGHAFSVILIDIDHFKSVNDRFGHGVGDQTLVVLAARATEMLRDVDTLGRWGGEEFVLVLPQTEFAHALQKAAELCTHIAARPLVGEHTITISCGVATAAAGEDADSLLRRADGALYAAKSGGRNRAEGNQ